MSRSLIKLSDELQEVYRTAQRYAVDAYQSEIGAFYLLLALIETSSGVRDWLEKSGCENTSRLCGKLKDQFTVRVQGALYPEPTAEYLLASEEARAIASELESPQILPKHLLIALLRVSDDLNAWLVENGITPAPIERDISTPLLDLHGRDLTNLAAQGRLGELVGRGEQLKELIETLVSHGKNSALLLGPPGTGKTAIVEKLAQEISNKRVTSRLIGMRLVELNLTSLIAGTSYRGEFEDRIERLIAEVDRSGNTILVIDEFHNIVGAGSTEGTGPDASNIIKPALARGTLTVIGITTHEEYRKYIEGDKALTRRFHTIQVSEPTESETLRILHQLKPGYEAHHGVRVEENALDAIIRTTGRYLKTRYWPDKAIDVLAKTCSRAEIEHLDCVNSELVFEIVSELIGMPVAGHNAEDELARLANLEKILRASVVGQQHVIQQLVSAIHVSRMGLRDPRLPRGVFLFAGPSGVGKTYLAQTLAAELFGTQRALIRIDMSEYSEKFNISKLIGAAPGYVGYEEPGQLTEPLRLNPASIVLLDEIEKAHPEVFDLFLQLFDEGRITDSHGNLVDGRSAYFILTTNLGVSETSIGFLGSSDSKASSNYEQAIRSFFRPELLNRIDHLFYFCSLSSDEMAQITEHEISALISRLEEQSLRLSYEAGVVDFIAALAMKQNAGARGVKRLVEEHIAGPISSMLLAQSEHTDKTWLHASLEFHQILLEWI